MANWLYYFFCPLDSKDIIKNKLSGFKKKYNKSKFCTLIARHDITNMRKPIYDLVSTIDAVECPSNFLHNDDSLHKQYNNDKKKYLQQYKFNICPENSINPGYVSEKPFEALYSGCIPIYTGWNRDFEPGIINPNIVMFFEPDSDNTALVQEIKRLHENERLYKAFMAQEYFMDTAVDKIYAMLQIYNEKISEIVEKCIKEKEYGKIS
jgi:glycosyltransferase involved in cell wall biosynthesis